MNTILDKTYKYPTVLTIAGFDSGGGAGIQADIKTISALGCYATSVLTALPVQNTTGVKSVYPIPANAVEDQLNAIMEDIVPDAIKIGMVHQSDIVKVIASILQKHPSIPIIYDPVMVSSSGHRLMDNDTVQTIIEILFPLVTILTPNMDEAALLSQMKVETIDDMYTAGEKIKSLGCRSVLVKGGHLQAKHLTSLYFAEYGSVYEHHSEKIDTNNTHGTGCTLSSAIASYIARGKSLKQAVTLAQQYVEQAIHFGADVKTGNGKGPLNHFFEPVKMVKMGLG